MTALPYIPKKFARCGKIKLKSRHFLLLEVIIAIAIVSLCIFPLITPHIWMIQEEKGLLQDIETARYVSTTLAYITQKLYINEYNWDEIISGAKEFTLNKGEIHDIDPKWPYEFSFIASKILNKNGEEEGETFYKLNIRIIVTDPKENKIVRKDDYVLFVERIIKEGKNETSK